MLRMLFGFVHMLEKPQCSSVIMQFCSFPKKYYIMGPCKAKGKENNGNKNSSTTLQNKTNKVSAFTKK